MSGEPHRDSINAQLAGMFTTNTTEGTVTGGSFAFTETEMLTIIKNWRDLEHSYRESLYKAETMSRIEPPADDFASRWHANAANRSGESYRRYLEHNRDYCKQQAELFQKTLDDYLDVEQTNATEMNKTTPQSGI